MEEKYYNIQFPKLKSHQKWLDNWWKKNLNTFLLAIENEDIQKEISDYRKIWLTDEIAKIRYFS
jgi:hypothetical protein